MRFVNILYYKCVYLLAARKKALCSILGKTARTFRQAFPLQNSKTSSVHCRASRNERVQIKYIIQIKRVCVCADVPLIRDSKVYLRMFR